MNPLMNAIEINNLTKKFGELTAVDSVSVSVKQGEIFGLLGPNGAGKTTLISMLVTMKKPTAGKATVNGFDIAEQPDEVRKSIGIIFQDPSLDEELTAYENLELHAAMYGVAQSEIKKRINEVIEMVELKDKANEIVKTFSGGMRRRLEIARGLLHYPKILFLDEPTVGLDPQTRKHIWEYVKKLKDERGVTVVLTTHYMEEADSLCDRVAIIDNGKIITLNSPTELKNSLGGDTIVIATSKAAELAAKAKKFKWTKEVTPHDGRLTIRVANGEKKIPLLIEAARKSKISIQSVSLHKPTLDDVFLHYTGKTIREEERSTKESIRIRTRAWSGRR